MFNLSINDRDRSAFLSTYLRQTHDFIKDVSINMSLHKPINLPRKSLQTSCFRLYVDKKIRIFTTSIITTCRNEFIGKPKTSTETQVIVYISNLSGYSSSQNKNIRLLCSN